MRIFPKLYRTLGAGCEKFLFIRLRKTGGWDNQSLWQGVRKLWGPIYVNVRAPFWVWPNMFYRK